MSFFKGGSTTGSLFVWPKKECIGLALWTQVVTSQLGEINTWQPYVPLSGSQFFRLHPRTRKAYDILTWLEFNSLPQILKYKHIQDFTEISIEPRLKQKNLLTQEKQFMIHTFPSIENQQQAHHILKTSHNLWPNSYVESIQ